MTVCDKYCRWYSWTETRRYTYTQIPQKNPGRQSWSHQAGTSSPRTSGRQNLNQRQFKRKFFVDESELDNPDKENICNCPNILPDGLLLLGIAARAGIHRSLKFTVRVCFNWTSTALSNICYPKCIGGSFISLALFSSLTKPRVSTTFSLICIWDGPEDIKLLQHEELPFFAQILSFQPLERIV